MAFWGQSSANKTSLKFHVHSEAGHGHENEDAVEVRPHPDDSTAFLCVLADGQGGQFGGGPAARLAVETVLSAALKLPVHALSQERTWRELAEAADVDVARDSESGFCTLVALLCTPALVCGVSCGDSTAVLYTPEERPLTAGQKKNPPVGSGGAMFVGFRRKLEPGNSLIVASDGVWKFAGWETMERHAKAPNPSDAIAAMRTEVLERNRVLPDDFSAVVIQVVGKLAS